MRWVGWMLLAMFLVMVAVIAFPNWPCRCRQNGLLIDF